MGGNGLVWLIFEYEFEVLEEVRGLWGCFESFSSGVEPGFNIVCEPALTWKNEFKS